MCTRQCQLYNWVICCVPNSCGGCPSFIFFLSGGNGTSDSRACCGTKTAVVETSVTGWRLKYMLLDLVSSCYQVVIKLLSKQLDMRSNKSKSISASSIDMTMTFALSLHVQEFTFRKMIIPP